VASDDEKRDLRDEAHAWVAFWRESQVKDPRIDQETINVLLLRYYNAGALTEDELDSLSREAGVQPFTMGTTRHPQARIEHGGKSADVDEEIAPLVLELWRANLWTIASCQDLGGRVSIEFEDGRTPRHFSTSSLTGAAATSIRSTTGSSWKKNPTTGSTSGDIASGNTELGDRLTTRKQGPPDFEFWGVAVRFPRSDLDEALRRVRDFNAAQASP